MRLVGAHTMPDRSPLRVEKRTPRPSDDHQRAVAQENQRSASLTVQDARWAFAVRVASSIEGGKAGIMRPEVRTRLLTQAGHLGLRPFDANLIIAIVQDSARTGGNGLDEHAANRLKLIRGPQEVVRAARWPFALAMVSSMIALVLAWLVIRWLQG